LTRLLIISPDNVDTNMAGVGIRYWEISRALVPYHQVTLAIPNETALRCPGLTLQTYDSEGNVLKGLAAANDAIMVQGFVLYNFPFLVELGQPLIVDVYTPIILENLEVHTFRTMAARQKVHERDLQVVLDQLRRGDFFVCANERQRDYWLGILSALGRLDPYNYQVDKSLRRLIDVVPFGLPEEPPQHSQRVLKGMVPGIGESDRVILWGGGVWPWFDPLSLIEAMPQVVEAHPEARLLFWSRQHPNAEISAVIGSGMHTRAVELSQELGLYQKAVFFHDQWVPYQERQDYLLEADVGVCLHQELAETRLAFRTRLMDYIWAGLPMVVSAGDSLSEVVEGSQLGKVVSCGDAGQIAHAITGLLSLPDPREAYRERFEAVREQFTWMRAVQPLLRFLESPQRAADAITSAGRPGS